MPKIFIFNPPVTKIVSNPNILSDTIEMLQLGLSEEELNEKLQSLSRKTDREKLATLIDRLEFIGHLELLKSHAGKSKFYIEGQEVVGIDNDIDSLRIYLALTCIDIFSGNYTSFQNWISFNSEDFNCESETIQNFLIRKKASYEEIYKLSTGFIKAFLDAPDSVRQRLSNNLIVKSKSSANNDIASYS